jgi:hypothetical protein
MDADRSIARTESRTPMHRTRLFTLFAASVALAPAARAAITLDANFDSGSLKSYSVSRDAVNLIGRDSYAFNNHQLGSGDWRWIYFKATGVQGQNLTFSISGEFAGDDTNYPPSPSNHELKDHEMVYSYDNVNWNFFPHANNQLLNIETPDTNGANDIFKFGLGQPFMQDTVYVAYALPYQYSRTVALTQQVLNSPWGMPTASAHGNADGIIGQSPAGVDDIGRSIPALNLYAYRITNPATDSTTPKHKVMIATVQHAAETLGIHTYEGLVKWLISDDPRAAALRDKVEVFGYPTLNASGRYAGLSRAMLQFPNTDSNGYWSPVSGNSGYVNPERTEQKINGEAMRTDKASTPGNNVDLFLDLHSSVPDYNIVGPNGEGGSLNPGDGLYRDDWGYITTGHENDPWWLALRALQPNLLQRGSSTSGTTLPAFARTYLNAQMSVTLENQFAISRPVSFYQDYGKNIGLAMYQAYVRVTNALPGDFDEDGDVDQGDLAAWRQFVGTLTGAQHYQGDANGDGRVDGADLLLWQQQFGTAVTTAVPEPTSLIIVFLLSAAILRQRQHAK